MDIGELVIGGAIGTITTAVVVGIIALIKKNVSVKTKMDIRVDKLETQQKHTDSYLSDFCPLVVKGLRAILLNLLQGETNGPVKEALSDLLCFQDQKSNICDGKEE